MFAGLVTRAGELAGNSRRSRAILGITGPPGAGKTTLAQALVAGIAGAQHVPMDGFHLADIELDRLGRRERKGAADTFDAAGYVALLSRIRAARESDIVYAPAFDRVLEQPVAGSIAVDPGTTLVVTEGNYLLHGTADWTKVRPLLDEVWWVELDANERFKRLVRRHQQFGKTRAAATSWVREVDEANADVVQPDRAAADLIVQGALEGLIR